MLTDRDIEYNTPIQLGVDAGSTGIAQLCIEKGKNHALTKEVKKVKKDYRVVK